MKLRRARCAKRGRVEIIPMIDVMFFLLATFMLASLSMQRLDAVRMNLPQGHAQPMTTDKTLTLSVDRSNRLFVNRQEVRPNQVTQAVARQLGSDGNVVVAADEHAAHGVVTQAMLAARRAGGKHFLLAVNRD